MIYVVFDSKYGNTKLVAEKIVEGISQVKGTETSTANVKAVDMKKIADSDAILIGSPNHIGKPARRIEEFIGKLSKIDLKARWVAVFDTHLANDMRAHDKMEKMLCEKVPGLRLITPGLSIRVEGFLKGPISEGELPKSIEFGKAIAMRVK